MGNKFLLFLLSLALLVLVGCISKSPLVQVIENYEKMLANCNSSAFDLLDPYILNQTNLTKNETYFLTAQIFAYNVNCKLKEKIETSDFKILEEEIDGEKANVITHSCKTVFYLDEKVTYCGNYTYTLVKIEDSWKIHDKVIINEELVK